MTRGPQRNTQPGFGNCTGRMCTVFRVNANSTFPSGTYTFRCYYDGNQVRSYSWTEYLAAGSYVDLRCILGNPYGTQRTATVTVSISPGNGVTVEPKPWPIL